MPKQQKPFSIVGQIFKVQDLTGGTNLRPTATNIRANQATLLLNTLLANVGELGIYPGWKNFTDSQGARRLQGGKRVYISGSTFTVVADNGSVYKPSDNGGAANTPYKYGTARYASGKYGIAFGSAVLTGLNATNAVDFPNDRLLVAAFDGATTPQKSLNGTTWTQLGITAPAAQPTLAADGAGGSLVQNDVYEVTYTYQNSTLNEESNESAVGTFTADANKSIAVTYVASTDTQVDKIKIYARDKTAGEATRRLVVTVTNASSSTNITSNSWGTAAPSPAIGANSVALAMKFGTVWKNRMWGADGTIGNRLRFTQVFQHVWPDTYYVDIPFERGEGLTALVAIGDILVVFGSTKFYLILGQTSLDFEVRPALGAQTGAFGFRAVDIVEASIVHGGGPGVYLYNGAVDQLLSYPIEPAWISMMQSGSTTQAELNILPIVHHKLRKEIRVAVPYLYPLGGRGEWILDLNRTNAPSQEERTQAWFSTDRTIGGYISWDGNEPNPNDQGRIFSWSPTVAQLLEERTGTSANGQDMTMQYYGYMVPFGLQAGRIIDTYIEYQPVTTQTTFSATLFVDGVLHGPQALSMVGSATSKYGTAKYATAQYGIGTARAVLPVVWDLGADGRTAQLRLTYVGQGQPKIYTYGHNVQIEPFPRGI